MKSIVQFLFLGVGSLGVSSAFAQPLPPSGPIQRPVISPYLNLLNGSGSPALNYFGLVLPQQQLAQQFGQLQQQATQTNLAVNQALAQDASALNSILAPTGTVAAFNSTGNYFNRYGNSFGSFGSSSGGMNRGGLGASSAIQRPSYAGGSGIGGINRPAVGGRR